LYQIPSRGKGGKKRSDTISTFSRSHSIFCDGSPLKPETVRQEQEVAETAKMEEMLTVGRGEKRLF